MMRLSHGFISGDTLTIREVKRVEMLEMIHMEIVSLIKMIQQIYTVMISDHCGLQVEVQDIVSAHRFTVLKKGSSGLSHLNRFINSYGSR